MVGLHAHQHSLPAPRHDFEAEAAAQHQLAAAEAADPLSGNGQIDSGNGSDEKVGAMVQSSMPDSSEVASTSAAHGVSNLLVPKIHEDGTNGTGTVTVQVKETSLKRSGAPIISHTFNSGMYRKVEVRSHDLLPHLIETARLREIANKERAQAAGVVFPLNSGASSPHASSDNNNNTNNNESASGGASASGMDASNEESSAAFSGSPAGMTHNGAGTPTAASAAAASRAMGDGRITPPMHPRIPQHLSNTHSLSNVHASPLTTQTSGGAAPAGLASSASVDTGLAQQSQPTIASIVSPAAAAVAAVNFVRRMSRAVHDSKTPQARAFDRRYPPLINWIQIPRADRHTMQIIGKHFRISDKQVDEVLSLDQLPSVDGYDNNLCFVFHMQGLLDEEKGPAGVIEEQMSVIFLHELQTVITINESAKLSDCFERILAKLSFERSKIRLLNDASFLCYSFVDAVVDYTFPILEKYSRRINWLEKDMLSFEPVQDHMDESGVIKSNLLAVRMNLWRLRELLTELIQDEYNCISTESKKYMRDVYIHTENMVEVVESQLEGCTGLLSIYNNFQGGKTNTTVAVLTNLSAVLLPAQFLTGVYGMNFKVFPELVWEWSYLLFWVVVVTIGIGTAIFLWKQGEPMKRKEVPQHLKESGKTLKRRTSVSSIKMGFDTEPSTIPRGPFRGAAAESKRILGHGGQSSSALVRAVGVMGSGDMASPSSGAATIGSPSSVGSPSSQAANTPLLPPPASSPTTASSSSSSSATAPSSSGPSRRPLMIGAPAAAPPLISAVSARLLTGKDNFGVELPSRSGGRSTSPLPPIIPPAGSRYEVPGVVHEH